MKIWDLQYKTLNHWRAIAALWVVAFHSYAVYVDPKRPFHPLVQAIEQFNGQGYLGVHLFFVISGYCIAASVYKLSARNGNSREFVINRFWRIYPTYWAALVVSIIINLIASSFNNTTPTSNLLNGWQAWLGHILLAQPYFNTSFYVGVYWTLTIEVAFYLIVAILLIVKNLFGQKLALFIGLSLGFASIFAPLGTMFTFISYWNEFVCGILVFSALLAKYQNQTYHQNLSLILIVIFGLLGIWVDKNYHSSTLWFAAVFAIGLYVLYGFDKKIDSIRQLHWLKYLGIMSYSLYLIHVPFQAKVMNLGIRFVPVDSPMLLILQIFALIVALGTSYIFYQLVEKPLNNWRHHRNQINKGKNMQA
jgi:peptidoglycan/LPS O-acetylase OafA/YrhL